MQTLLISPVPIFVLPSREGAGREDLLAETEEDAPCFTLGLEEMPAAILPEVLPGDAPHEAPATIVSALIRVQMAETGPPEDAPPVRTAVDAALPAADTGAKPEGANVTGPPDGVVLPVPPAPLPRPPDSAEGADTGTAPPCAAMDDAAGAEKTAAHAVMAPPGLPPLVPRSGHEASVSGDRRGGGETEFAAAQVPAPAVHTADTADAETGRHASRFDPGGEAPEALPDTGSVALPASVGPGDVPEAAPPNPRADWPMARSETVLRFRAGFVALPHPFIGHMPADSSVASPNPAPHAPEDAESPSPPAPGIGPPVPAVLPPVAAGFPDSAPLPQAGVAAFTPGILPAVPAGVFALPEGREGTNAVALPEQGIAVSPAPAVSPLAMPPEGGAASAMHDTIRAMAEQVMAALPQPAWDNNAPVTVAPPAGGAGGDAATAGIGESPKVAAPGSEDLPPGRPAPEAAPERMRPQVMAALDGFGPAQPPAAPADEAAFTAAIASPAAVSRDSVLPANANRPLPPTLPVQIAHAAVSAEGPVTELRLSPEELGSVRIELVTEGEKVSVTILAERPETLDLMRRHADRLAAELRAAGFSQLDLGFGQGGAGETGNRAAAGGQISSGTTAESPGPVPVAAPRLSAGSNLYLRL